MDRALALPTEWFQRCVKPVVVVVSLVPLWYGKLGVLIPRGAPNNMDSHTAIHYTNYTNYDYLISHGEDPFIYQPTSRARHLWMQHDTALTSVLTESHRNMWNAAPFTKAAKWRILSQGCEAVFRCC